jgi:SulP family sulfate permease
LMGVMQLGRIIQVIPYPVVVGFTSGIGVVIATLQLADFLGLDVTAHPVNFHQKVLAIIQALPTLRWQELLIGVVSFSIIMLWKKIHSRIPGYLIALLVGSLLGLAFNHWTNDLHITTIATRFSYELGGQTLPGIPGTIPQFVLPWNWPGADGQAMQLSLATFKTLLGAAFAIAVLGALESLLCALVSDGMSGHHHNSDSELIGQGIGNIAVAFFGGIPATAAIARTATNVRSGGTTPLAAIVHGITVLLAMLIFAKWLAYIPMSSMAAVLIVVAWNMSEARHAVRIVQKAPRSDAIVYLACFILTVFVDMQIAIAIGMMLASFLFIRRMIDLTGTSLVDHKQKTHEFSEFPDVVVYDVDGPLFFGAAYKALRVITSVDKKIRAVVLDMRDVGMLDVTAMTALESTADSMRKRNTQLILCHVKPRLIQKLERFGISEHTAGITFADTLLQAKQILIDKFSLAPTPPPMT